ncbi:MAG: hypothetical protein IMZ50_09900 [Candidatus Atribacteria bacterium]|nr:hypothetical protein [Candidatus Atribacteria bacterium]
MTIKGRLSKLEKSLPKPDRALWGEIQADGTTKVFYLGSQTVKVNDLAELPARDRQGLKLYAGCGPSEWEAQQ